MGARLAAGGRTVFRVWAPAREAMSVRIISGGVSRIVPLGREEGGWFAAEVAGVKEGDRYLYILDDGTERPDPSSEFQPDGVHAPSQVANPQEYPWSDGGWRGRALEDYVIYELHVGTFTGEGSFAAIIPMLEYLVGLGVTAVELMPVAQFPGKRNWGYDGVYPFAPQNSYGGPPGFKKLVDACHGRGLAVILDVVYNHLGPEGNYLGSFGPYFTDRYRTPWGEAVNLDGAWSDEVRRFFIANALFWVNEYHVDALRLDAVHGIFDFGARHFLEELAAAVHGEAGKLGRKVYVIAESDLNDVRLIDPPCRGGDGIDAQWNDDFHHALHALLTGEREGYYVDFGGVAHFVKSLRERFVYSGEYSRYRKRRHGNSARGRSAGKFVVFAQNHDQVGNRPFGERLAALVPFESLKLAAGAVLLSPYIPLLFMGEEYGEDAPFLYFTDHSDPGLNEAVRRGRMEEHAYLAAGREPPDNAAPETFLRSKPDLCKRESGNHAVLFQFYAALIRARKEIPALAVSDKGGLRASAAEAKKLVLVERWQGESRALCLFNFNEGAVGARFPRRGERWHKLLDSADAAWNGPGALLPETVRGGEHAVMAGRSCALYLTGNGH